MNKIIYVGNDLVGKTKYFSVMEKLYKSLTLEGFKIKKTSSKSNQLLRLFDMVYTVIKHRKWADVVLIDTFSTHSFYYAYIVSQLCRLFKIKYIPILHGGNLPYRLNSSKRMSKGIFKNSLHNVSPSGYLKDEFEKNGFKTKLIPNSIELSDFSYKERALLSPKLLYVRALDKTYNPIMAIKVLGELKKTYPKAVLCMVGPDKDGSLSEVKEEIRALKLSDSIEIKGTLERHEWYKLSKDYDIFINTTNVDNTPVSVLEAMALGLTVVSTNVGGLPYLITHQDDGILVEKNDHIGMSEAIKEAIETNNLNFSKNARKKAETFTWSEIKTKWIELLK